MKVTPEHLATMRKVIAPLDTEERRERYRRREIPRGDLVQDIDKRYRFDLFYGAGAPESRNYADAHLDTALRKIVRPLSCTPDCTTDCGACKGVRP